MKVKISPKLSSRVAVVAIHRMFVSPNDFGTAHHTPMACLAAHAFDRTELVDVQYGQTPLVDPPIDYRLHLFTQPTCAHVIHRPVLFAVLAQRRSHGYHNDPSRDDEREERPLIRLPALSRQEATLPTDQLTVSGSRALPCTVHERGQPRARS